MITFEVSTSRREEMIDITERVAGAVRDSDRGSGICVVYVPHTTAAVTINEGADRDVQADILKHLSKMVPEHGGFAHMEGNSDAHIKTLLTGSSETVIVESGRLVLGTWQRVFFCEFDGPRTRRVKVSVTG